VEYGLHELLLYDLLGQLALLEPQEPLDLPDLLEPQAQQVQLALLEPQEPLDLPDPLDQQQ